MNPEASGRRYLALILLTALAGCTETSWFQLINQTPYDIVYFAVEDSEEAPSREDNLLDEPLAPGRMASAAVSGGKEYWLWAAADVAGALDERTEGPVHIGAGNVGWAWHVEGGRIRAGTGPEDVFAKTDLPAVVIDTYGCAIPDEPKIAAVMHIACNEDGLSNEPLGEPSAYSGLIAIERRGFSSQLSEKLSWGFETKDAVAQDCPVELLGLPEEEDWVLYGPYIDRTLMRNVLVYGVANDMGWYAPRTMYCEVYLNETQAKVLARTYHGVYVLTEKIKRGADRVDIEGLDEGDVTEPKISGGYLLEMKGNVRVGADEVAFPIAGGDMLSVRYPRPDRLNDAQLDWISGYIGAFEDALSAAFFDDPGIGYAKYIDVDSFIDYIMVQDLFKNHDAFRGSTFMYKNRGERLHMGPVWDFNISLGNLTFWGFENPEGWFLQTGVPLDASRPWPERLFDDPAFARRYVERWFVLRQDTLSVARLHALIDSYAAELETAQARNFIRWPTLEQILMVPAYFGPHPGSFEAEVRQLKDWLAARVLWIDENIEGLAGDVSR